MYFTTSSLVIPALFGLPINESTRIFADLYHNGKGVQIPLTVGSSFAYALAAYLTPEKRTELGVAGLLCIGTMAFTAAFMFGGIDELLNIRGMDGSQIQRVQKSTVNGLLESWRQQNFVRAALSFAGGMLGLYAVI